MRQLLVGLYDPDIQEDLLAMENLDLNKAEKYVTDREAAKWSQASMSGADVSGMTTYQKNKRSAAKKESDNNDPKKCGYCGGPEAHNGTDERKDKCPAWGNLCPCGKTNHLCAFEKESLQRRKKTGRMPAP